MRACLAIILPLPNGLCVAKLVVVASEMHNSRRLMLSGIDVPKDVEGHIDDSIIFHPKLPRILHPLLHTSGFSGSSWSLQDALAERPKSIAASQQHERSLTTDVPILSGTILVLLGRIARLVSESLTKPTKVVLCGRNPAAWLTAGRWPRSRRGKARL